MGKAHNPRHGSMQYWPRVRAKRETAKVSAWADSNDVKPLGFAGYKVGMTHVQYKDMEKKSPTKGEFISEPVTIVECPPIKVMGVRFYNTVNGERRVVKDFLAETQDKEMSRKLKLPKTITHKLEAPEKFDALMLVVNTQPSKTGIGKKKPELFEVAIGGSKDEQLAYAKENLGKELNVKDIFQEGEFLDIHAITIGKGTQGPVKRFGVAIRHHKSEKTKRGPGSLGSWKGQAHVMYRVAHAGQHGYHVRTTYNQQLYKIGETPEEVNAKGGFIRYGAVKNSYVMIKGSLHGPSKRLIRFCKAIRANPKKKTVAPAIEFVSIASRQGNRI
jgi:large subunit ribosomal protein L3